MRLTTGGKVGNFFRRIGKGIKKVAIKAYDVGKKVVGKIKEYAPRVFGVAKKVAEASGNEKFKGIVDKGEKMYDKAYEKGKQIYDKGKQMYDQGKQAYIATKGG